MRTLHTLRTYYFSHLHLILLSLAGAVLVLWWYCLHEVIARTCMILFGISSLELKVVCALFFAGMVFGAAAFGLAYLRLQERHLTTLTRNPLFVAAGGILVSTLTLWSLSTQSIALIYCIQLISSAFGTVLMLGFLEAIDLLPMESFLLVLAGVLLFRGLINYLIVPLLPTIGTPYDEIVLLVVSLCTYVLLCSLEQRFASPPAKATAVENVQSPFSFRQALLPVALVLALATFSMLFSFLHATATAITPNPFAQRIVRFAAYALGAALLGGFACSKDAFFPWPFLRIVVFPLTVLSFMMLPFIIEPFSTQFSSGWALSIFFTQTGNAVFDMSALALMLFVSRESRQSFPLCALQFFAIEGMFGVLGVTVATLLEFNGLLSNLFSLTLVSVIVFVLLVASVLWVGTDKAARRIWGMRIEKTPRQYRDDLMERRIAKLAENHGLTPRQQEVAILLAEGNRPKEISHTLVISSNTVNAHIKAIYSKFNVHSFDEYIALLKTTD